MTHVLIQNFSWHIKKHLSAAVHSLTDTTLKHPILIGIYNDQKSIIDISDIVFKIQILNKLQITSV